jgi:CRP-like cAMP-binding protein
LQGPGTALRSYDPAQTMVTAQQIRESSPFFRRLSREDLDRLAGIALAKTYEKGDLIFSEGDEPRFLHTIASGRVKVVKGVPSGKEIILEILSTGDPLGAVVAYEERPYPATAVALERTVCLLLPRSEFFSLLERHPSVVRGFLSGMARRIVELTQRVPAVAGGRVETRFALLFLKLAEKAGRAEGGEVFVPIHLTRQDLADLTSTTIETSIRVMSRWSKEELVSTEPEGFRVRDREALERLARG